MKLFFSYFSDAYKAFIKLSLRLKKIIIKKELRFSLKYKLSFKKAVVIVI